MVACRCFFFTSASVIGNNDTAVLLNSTLKLEKLPDDAFGNKSKMYFRLNGIEVGTSSSWHVVICLPVKGTFMI